MSEFRPVIVVPVAPGRLRNVGQMLASIEALETKPLGCVFVEDGPGEYPQKYLGVHEMIIRSRKHEPGHEQPRNVGAFAAKHAWRDANAVWFLDSDLVFRPDALTMLKERWEASDHGRVIIAPYDWLGPDELLITGTTVTNDPRWEMFNEERWSDLTYESTGQLNVGLGCFSGNLVWPMDAFVGIGGFWNELNHGRCEDGELGLRAVAEEVPITIERRARGYHLSHDRNMDWILEANRRDVPMINARHPWVEGEGLFVVEKDGKRFDQMCPICNTLINTGDFWNHKEMCHGN